MNKKQKTKKIQLPKDQVESIEEGPFSIVGIGASAGGLASFESFFKGMPTDTLPNMAFVIVQHLAPDHTSLLTEIISRYTSMNVFEVHSGVKVEKNCVYIIPPNRDMALLHGTLELLEPSTKRGFRLPIDFFFRSLAEDQHERAICIVLSGTGSDGTQGLRAIKVEGGMAIAEEPHSADYDGMPSSAIATGMVDYVLAPSEMLTTLMTYSQHALLTYQKRKLYTVQRDENALKKVFIFLRDHTGHDFSGYKLNTIYRRLERRMALHQIDVVDDYMRYLQNTPAEIEALFREFLIGVTNFFRDSEAFDSLKQIIPRLLVDKGPSETIRVWVAGCSTGEEAYSIAMLLEEQMQEVKKNYSVQIFATDIDSQAIATARAGVYPIGIKADVSSERLTRFFTENSEHSTFRIQKKIRDMLIFSEHDVVKDPPFLKLDLVSCRNLLIYMGIDLQKKLIPLFHYALRPKGILFLGSSETLGEFSNLYTTLDAKNKLYRRVEDEYYTNNLSIGRVLKRTGLEYALPLQVARTKTLPAKLSMKELTEKTLLEEMVPAAALVNAKGDIYYLHGHTGMYLELPAGETSINNILKMARKGLQRPLSIALHKAIESKMIVHSPKVNVQLKDNDITLHLRILPLAPTPSSDDFVYLVILEEVPSLSEPEKSKPSSNGVLISNANEKIEALTEDLHIQETYLQEANEKLEVSNEELRSFNEEMQSMNEELQSTNEELETSKEELQSLNEELSTVNAELQVKVTDLSRSNNDMNNLLAGTGVGTIFVDHKLCILRFTPAVTNVINLISGDVGRPVSHIASNLIGYDSLETDIKKVLETLAPKEIEVQAVEGKWYIMRIQPYRTLDNVIEGAVITFVDVTETIRMREKLRKANMELARMAVIVNDSYDAIIAHDMKGNIIAWNKEATKMYGWSENEALNMNVEIMISKEHVAQDLNTIKQLSVAHIIDPYRTERLTKEGKVKEIWMTSTALVDASGNVYAITTIQREMK